MINSLRKTDDFIKMINLLSKTDDLAQVSAQALLQHCAGEQPIAVHGPLRARSLRRR